jgi:hypothetical protein
MITYQTQIDFGVLGQLLKRENAYLLVYNPETHILTLSRCQNGGNYDDKEFLTILNVPAESVFQIVRSLDLDLVPTHQNGNCYISQRKRYPSPQQQET